LFHDDTVESIALAIDEKLLFTGSLDQRIGIWSMSNFSLITYLKTTFPIRTLNLTDDNDYLIAFEKSDGESQIFTWALEKNEDAFRININLTKFNFQYVTPDNMYLAMISDNSIEIWNIKSRTMI
jgi:WD40 repeat protein